MTRAFVIALTAFLSTGIAFAQTDAQAQIAALQKQIADLQAQMAASAGMSTQTANQTPPTPAVGNAPADLTCPVFARTLARGTSGDDVLMLQKVLRSGKYLIAEPTGYFGPLTEKALQTFQAKAGIVANGTPQTTGWGVFGPRTRALFAKLCAEQLAIVTAAAQEPQACPTQAPAVPSDSCAGEWQPLLDTRQCHVGWRCAQASFANSNNKPPTINSVDGPTSLLVNQFATWTIKAQDPEGGTLSYNVIWGDEDIETLLNVFAGINPPSFSGSPTIRHYFTKAGTYSPEITVRDTAGNTAVSTLFITVGGSATSSTPPSLPTTIGTTGASSGQCIYQGTFFPEGTKTEGHTINDLCLSTGGTCLARSSYTPVFVCKAGDWVSAQAPPTTNLPNYGNMVGAQCAPTGSTALGATTKTTVAPGTQLCRGLVCATAQNYATIMLTCQYEAWVDWGIFTSAAASGICAEPSPCEYLFGDQGRACGAKVNGQCPVPTAGVFH